MLSTTLVILGITGDLAQKKIIPALFNLYRQQKLSASFSIIGFGRREWSGGLLRQYIQGVMKTHGFIAHESLPGFLTLFSYEQGSFEANEGYEALARRLDNCKSEQGMRGNIALYLSVPPHMYIPILERIRSTGIAKSMEKDEGWVRLLIEKPFGDNYETAKQLNTCLAKMFTEEQIYRIDHYLAKEVMQNILAFRFANNLFEGVWNNTSIERIDIRVWELLGVEKRGAFYDSLGALRDVGQNHLLEMLALITMEHPGSLEPGAVRARREGLLRSVRLSLDPEYIVRGQYKGYLDIEGVTPGSTTETFFRVNASIDTDRWRGVPMSLEFGKRMPEVRKEIVVTFKHPIKCLCEGQSHTANSVTFSLEPEEITRISFAHKAIGSRFTLASAEFDFRLRGEGPREQYVEEYERLILDSLRGDQTLFASAGEIAATWKAIDPVRRVWGEGAVPVVVYEPGTYPRSCTPSIYKLGPTA